MIIYHAEEAQEDEMGNCILTFLTFDENGEKKYQDYMFPDPDKAKLVTDYFKTNIDPLTVEDFNNLVSGEIDNADSEGGPRSDN